VRFSNQKGEWNLKEKGTLKNRHGELVCEVEYELSEDGSPVAAHEFEESAPREVDDWAHRGGSTEVRLWPERSLSTEEQQELVLVDKDGRCFELVVASNPFAVPLLANATQRECSEAMSA
jgi:hypothetical protein